MLEEIGYFCLIYLIRMVLDQLDRRFINRFQGIALLPNSFVCSAQVFERNEQKHLRVDKAASSHTIMRLAIFDEFLEVINGASALVCEQLEETLFEEHVLQERAFVVILCQLEGFTQD